MRREIPALFLANPGQEDINSRLYLSEKKRNSAATREPASRISMIQRPKVAFDMCSYQENSDNEAGPA